MDAENRSGGGPVLPAGAQDGLEERRFDNVRETFIQSRVVDIDALEERTPGPFGYNDV